MQDKTITELVAIHNERAGDDDQLKGWKQAKALLIVRIEALKVRTGVGAFAAPLLTEVVSTDEDGNKIGRTYADILAMVRAEFPGAKTTTRSLAWYASNIRTSGGTVPFRPRSTSA